MLGHSRCTGVNACICALAAQEGSDRDFIADTQSDGQSGGGGSSQSGEPSAAMRTFDGFILWYKEKVQQLAPLLVQAQFDSSSRAGQQVEAIWHEVVRPKNLCKFPMQHQNVVGRGSRTGVELSASLKPGLRLRLRRLSDVVPLTGCPDSVLPILASHERDDLHLEA